MASAFASLSKVPSQYNGDDELYKACLDKCCSFLFPRTTSGNLRSQRKRQAVAKRSPMKPSCTDSYIEQGIFRFDVIKALKDERYRLHGNGSGSAAAAASSSSVSGNSAAEEDEAIDIEAEPAASTEGTGAANGPEPAIPESPSRRGGRVGRRRGAYNRDKPWAGVAAYPTAGKPGPKHARSALALSLDASELGGAILVNGSATSKPTQETQSNAFLKRSATTDHSDDGGSFTTDRAESDADALAAVIDGMYMIDCSCTFV